MPDNAAANLKKSLRRARAVNAQVCDNPSPIDFSDQALVQQNRQLTPDRLAGETREARELNGAHGPKSQNTGRGIADIAEIDARQQEPRRDVDPVEPLRPIEVLENSYRGFRWEFSGLRYGRGQRNHVMRRVKKDTKEGRSPKIGYAGQP